MPLGAEILTDRSAEDVGLRGSNQSGMRAHNERRFDVRWEHPAPKMGEYVQALRAIWRKAAGSRSSSDTPITRHCGMKPALARW